MSSSVSGSGLIRARLRIASVMWRPHSVRLMTRLAIPFGCRASRRTFTGGSSSCGAQPSANSSKASLASMRVPYSDTITAG
jgi:hypothetical protein